LRFDNAVAAIGPVQPWKTHDLRRTARTSLSRAKVSVFDAELIIAHQQSGVHAVYHKHRYQQEKLAGLLSWEQLLIRILDPTTSNRVETGEINSMLGWPCIYGGPRRTMIT
jgi:hypothetical protein